jgi:putative transcriptional regulator
MDEKIMPSRRKVKKRAVRRASKAATAGRAGKRKPRVVRREPRLPALDVAGIRAKTGLSQERFAVAFRISPHTLRNWEQGRRRPEGPARALILAIDRDPVALLRALGA